MFPRYWQQIFMTYPDFFHKFGKYLSLRFYGLLLISHLSAVDEWYETCPRYLTYYSPFLQVFYISNILQIRLFSHATAQLIKNHELELPRKSFTDYMKRPHTDYEIFLGPKILICRNHSLVYSSFPRIQWPVFVLQVITFGVWNSKLTNEKSLNIW